MTTLDIVIRTLAAVFFGAIVGREREINNRPAGIRTHALVCLGSAVIAMIQVEVVEHAHTMIINFPEMKNVITVNSGRIVAQVVSGIGFLGAGTILITKDKVRGLTTAASLWVVACVGIAIGYGYYKIAIISGLTVPIVLVGLKKLEKRVTKRSHHANLIITFTEQNNCINEMLKFFRECGLHVKEIKHLNSRAEDTENVIEFMLYGRHFKSWDNIIDDIKELSFVDSVKRKR